jgi:hypothetical protein
MTHVYHVDLSSGDMDLNPEDGQYRLSAEVPPVEVNSLGQTLAIRPLPVPMAGAIRGTLNCNGPLEEPLFSGESRHTASETPAQVHQADFRDSRQAH